MAAVAAMFAGVFICSFLISRVNAGRSVVDKLRSGKLSSSAVSRIEILRLKPSGWSFRERDYDGLERVRVTDPGDAEKLMSLLKEDSAPGIHHNHPTLLHSGLLRIEVHGSEDYYIFYQVYREQDDEYATIDANAANNPDPNSAQHFENIRIATFLRDHDPWYPKQ